MIYDYVYGPQVFRVTMDNGKARLVNTTYRRPCALSSTRRKLREDTAELLYTKTTFRIVTFRSISMMDNWNVAIRGDEDEFLNFLESIVPPQLWIENMEVVCVRYGQEVQGCMSYNMGVDDVRFYESGLDYDAELEGYIRTIYPGVNVVFRFVRSVEMLEMIEEREGRHYRQSPRREIVHYPRYEFTRAPSE